MNNFRLILLLVSILWITFSSISAQEITVATHWNEEVLEGIRNDFARPTVHARNLYHSSIIMYDAWAAYDNSSSQNYFLGQNLHGYTCDFDEANFTIPEDLEEKKEFQEIAISFAIYRFMKHRYGSSPQSDATMSNINARMIEMELDILDESTDYINDGPAALGNYLAEQIIAYGMQDGANEIEDYASLCYSPINPNIQPEDPGTNGIIDPNSWQAIELSFAIDQSGELLTSTPPFLGPEWGNVDGFAVRDSNLTQLERDGCIYNTYHNPGPPVYLDTTEALGFNESDYKWGFGMVVNWSQHLDPYNGVMWDISPASLMYDGSIPEISEYSEFYDWENGGLVAWHNEDGSFGGNGHEINPITGEAYEPHIVPRGDYGRVVAEFWADGPDSETPPGHWFTLLNEFILVGNTGENRWRGQGPIIDDLEFAVKSYLTLGGAMHDCAISAWSNKGYYDYIRPVSAIRYMAEKGQCSDPGLPNYHPAGLPLTDNLVDLVDDDSPLANFGGEDQVGKVSINCWKGPDYIEIPMIDEAGVDWILADQWWPYQRPSFVTPPFAGYFSGHSTFSRAAAELLELLTGSEYWPGGLAVWSAPMNEFLVFEDGPSMDVNLQWATYMDASNESALSRIWGGIHPPVDDAPGRKVGEVVGKHAFYFAETIVFPELAMEFGGDGFLPSGECIGDFNGDEFVGSDDFLLFLSAFGLAWTGPYDLDSNQEIGVSDLLQMLILFGTPCN